MKRIVIIGVAVLAILLLIGLLYWGKISKIKCQTQYGNCPEYYLPRVSFLLGKSIYFVPTQDISSALSSYVEIASLSISRNLPGTLILRIKLHEPFAVVNNYVVDDSGHIMAEASSSAVVNLIIDKNILPGQKLDFSAMESLRTLKNLNEIIPNSKAASLSGNILRVTVGETTELFFNVTALPEHWSDSLQLIFTRGKVDSKVPSRVDMRFNNPIIVY